MRRSQSGIRGITKCVLHPEHGIGANDTLMLRVLQQSSAHSELGHGGERCTMGIFTVVMQWHGNNEPSWPLQSKDAPNPKQSCFRQIFLRASCFDLGRRILSPSNKNLLTKNNRCGSCWLGWVFFFFSTKSKKSRIFSPPQK